MRIKYKNKKIKIKKDLYILWISTNARNFLLIDVLQ